jgi:hypothetical protein
MALSGAFWRFWGGLRHRSPISEMTYVDWPKLCVRSPKMRTKLARNQRLRLRNHPLIPFKDAKGIKDYRAAARAIYASVPRAMCAGPIHCEDSGKPRQQRELEITRLRDWLMSTVRRLPEDAEDAEDCTVAACSVLAAFVQSSCAARLHRENPARTG